MTEDPIESDNLAGSTLQQCPTSLAMLEQRQPSTSLMVGAVRARKFGADHRPTPPLDVGAAAPERLPSHSSNQALGFLAGRLGGSQGLGRGGDRVVGPRRCERFQFSGQQFPLTPGELANQLMLADLMGRQES
jgi:hypothetical protein